jgi:hypothetical protein
MWVLLISIISACSVIWFGYYEPAEAERQEKKMEREDDRKLKWNYYKMEREVKLHRIKKPKFEWEGNDD